MFIECLDTTVIFGGGRVCIGNLKMMLPPEEELMYLAFFTFVNTSFTVVDGPLPGETALLRAAHAPPGHPERIHHALIAGGIGGYFVWGHHSSLNQQIVLYLASRVIVGVWTRINEGKITEQSASGSTTSGNQPSRTFSFFASLVWAIVMALWEESPGALHPSLKKSMDEIYRYQLSQPELRYEEVDAPLESRSVKD